MEKFNYFSKKDIPDFIKSGDGIALQYKVLENSEYLDLFKLYSRNYMNFLMNHTNFIYILFIYGQLLETIDTNIEHIPNIIKLNNYVLSIISEKNYKDKITISISYKEYNNYFKSVTDLLKTNMDIVNIDNNLEIKKIVINLNILERKLLLISEYTEIELNDYIRFFYLISNELCKLKDLDFINSMLIQLKSEKKNKEFFELILYIIKSYYNILLNKFTNEINDITTVMTPLSEITKFKKDYLNDYNKNIVIINNKKEAFNYRRILVSGSIIVIFLLNMKFNFI